MLLYHLYNRVIPVKRFGLLVETDNRFVSNRNIAKLYWGIYESAELRMVDQYEIIDRDVIELGSSIGVVSSKLASKLSRANCLYLVEANPNLIPLIINNLKVNNHSVNYEILNKVVGYDHEEVRFVVSNNNTESKILTTEHVHEESLLQPTIELKDIVENYDLKDYILVSDIEGAEVEYLIHDTETLSLCKELIIELHETIYEGRNFRIGELHSIIVNLGFNLTNRIGNVFHYKR